MARDSNVQAVREGIQKAFTVRTDEAPTGTAIAAAAGVSLSTVNRVLRDHSQVRDALDLARASFDAGRGQRANEDSDEDRADPILANPRLAVRRLEQVVANLLFANETLRRDNNDLQSNVDELRTAIQRAPLRLPAGRDTRPDTAEPPSEADRSSQLHISDHPASLRRDRNGRRH